MFCQSRKCQQEATLSRTEPIDGWPNYLCDLCHDRIYKNYPHHCARWQKVNPAKPQPATEKQTVKPTANLIQPTLL